MRMPKRNVVEKSPFDDRRQLGIEGRFNSACLTQLRARGCNKTSPIRIEERLQNKARAWIESPPLRAVADLHCLIRCFYPENATKNAQTSVLNTRNVHGIDDYNDDGGRRI